MIYDEDWLRSVLEGPGVTIESALNGSIDPYKATDAMWKAFEGVLDDFIAWSVGRALKEDLGSDYYKMPLVSSTLAMQVIKGLNLLSALNSAVALGYFLGRTRTPVPEVYEEGSDGS